MIHARIEQTQWELWLPKAPVEAVDELIQILLQIVPRDSVKSAQQIGFEIANGYVYPGQPFIHPLGGRHTAFMLLRLPQNPQGYEAIRACRLLWEQMAFHELAEFSPDTEEVVSMATKPAFLPRLSTATRTGVFPSAPRPHLPPDLLPPTKASSTSTKSPRR